MLHSSDKLILLGYIVTLLILVCCNAIASGNDLNFFFARVFKIIIYFRFFIFHPYNTARQNQFERSDSDWKGNWFPHKPNEDDPILDGGHSSSSSSSSTTEVTNNNIESYTKKMKTMGIVNATCDDTEVTHIVHIFFQLLIPISTHINPQTICLFVFSISFNIEHICDMLFFHFLSLSFNIQRNLWIDYDPKNISHHSRYLCMQNRKPFEPSTKTAPILREYTVPVEYSVKTKTDN